MWLQYIEFCRRCHHDNTLSKLYGQVLSIHPWNSSEGKGSVLGMSRNTSQWCVLFAYQKRFVGDGCQVRV